MNMKRFAIAKVLFMSAAALFLLSSCGPYAYFCEVEYRKPAEKRGVDLSGNMVSILLGPDCLESDSAAYVSFAEGMAGAIESNLGLDSQSVFIFTGDTSSASVFGGSIGSDMVFEIDGIHDGRVEILDQEYVYSDYSSMMATYVRIGASIDYKIYDLNSESLAGKASGEDVFMEMTLLSDIDASNAELFNTAVGSKQEAYGALGQAFMSAYFPEWVAESRSLLVYDSKTEWVEAYYAACDFKWNEAMEFWMKVVDEGSKREAAAAAYNLAVACEIGGNYDSAIKWLDYADGLVKFPGSSYERSLIVSRSK